MSYDDNDLLADLIEWEEYQEAIDFLRRNPNPHNVTGEEFRMLCLQTCVGDKEESAVELARLMLQLKPNVAQYGAGEIGINALYACVRKRYRPDGTRAPPSTTLALLLIESYPEGVNDTYYPYFTMTPFHKACQANAEFAVLKAMLEVNPNLATQKCGGRTNVFSPLEFLWKANGSTIDNKITLILLTALKGRVMDHPLSTEHLAHAACNYECPRDFYLKLFEEEDFTIQLLMVRDDQGNLPLHYAVQQQTQSLFLIDSLLDMSPETAAMTDREGRLPLFIALANPEASWSRESILRIFEAHPQALDRRDNDNKLFPSLLAGMRANESTEHLSITYELLLKTPEIFSHAI